MLTQGFRDHVVDVTVPPLQERHLAHLSALIFQFLDASELLPENVKKENEALATDNERVWNRSKSGNEKLGAEGD